MTRVRPTPTRRAGMPGVPFPLVPGHEAAGRVEELGDGAD
ncbi:alcohol dehydrogenase catalytic domain-containing protein, partial [Streptomyces griseoincarnatus]